MTPRKRRLIAFLALLLVKKRGMCISKEPCRTSILSGHVFVQGILEANRRVCLELLRMEKHVFLRLCAVLQEKRLLEDSRFVSVEEQVAIFLMTVGQNHRNRILQDRFQHSGETIHRHFHAVLVAMTHLSMDIIKPPSYDQTPKEILHNPRFYPYFKDCVGAIDGTLVSAVIPVANQVPYRGRKGECQQNILAACSFDMLFTFVIAGWEGTAHDSRILLDTIYKPHLNFPHAPLGKFYIVDAGFTNMRGFLAPYRNVRYWLSDFRAGGRPRDRKEHFNYVHSSLRNVIERSFGVLKARFPILKRMPPYSFSVQRSIVVATMTLHNFIRKEAVADALFIQYENEEVSLEAINNDDSGNSNTDVMVDIAEQVEMSEVRNAIADTLFHSR